jgi:amidohydrolase
VTLDEELIELRREIHRHPELAGAERETAGLVAEQLRAAGLEVTTGVGGHGVLAVLDGSADGPTVAYRADMDAVDARTNVLSIPRSGRVFDEGFASRVPGVAHLCGHDLHTAIGVGVAWALAQGSEPVRGRLVFVFQPAEEPLQGARTMLETGLVQRFAPWSGSVRCSR